MGRGGVRLQRGPSQGTGLMEQRVSDGDRSSQLRAVSSRRARKGAYSIQGSARLWRPTGRGSAVAPGRCEIADGYWDLFRVRSNIVSTLSFMLTSQERIRGTPQSRGFSQLSPRIQSAPPGRRRIRPANVVGRSMPLTDSTPWMVRITSLFSASEGKELSILSMRYRISG